MVQSEFQDNSKTLIVPTNNIFDQKYCRIITRTSLSNSRNSFRKTFFQVSTKGYSSLFQENTKLLMVPTNNIFDQNYCRIITRTSLSNSRNSLRKKFFLSKSSTKGYSSWIKVNFKTILKRSWFLQATFLIKNTAES